MIFDITIHYWMVTYQLRKSKLSKGDTVVVTPRTKEKKYHEKQNELTGIRAEQNYWDLNPD